MPTGREPTRKIVRGKKSSRRRNRLDRVFKVIKDGALGIAYGAGTGLVMGAVIGLIYGEIKQSITFSMTFGVLVNGIMFAFTAALWHDDSGE